MLDEIINSISSKTGMERKEIEDMIEKKKQELSNLVSTEGAAIIVAKELGINTKPQKPSKKMEINQIHKGDRRIELKGKILKIGDIKEFERNGQKGRVVSVFIADGTGSIRLSLWDDQTTLIENLKEGDFIKITGAYARDFNEIRIDRSGSIEKIDETFEVVQKRKILRKAISELRDGDVCELRTAVVQIFKSNLLFEACPECGKRVSKREDGYYCETHKKIEPKLTMMISGVIDDGTGNMRAVFFRESAEKLSGLKPEDMQKIGVYTGNEILGKEFVITGVVKKNKLFGRLEIIVSDVKEVNLVEEINRYLNILN